MSRDRHPYLQFVERFVDSVTVRPFLADLKRIKDNPHIFMPLPRLPYEELFEDEDVAYDAA